MLPVYRFLAGAFALWTTLAVGIGRVISTVLGALLFYGVITAVALPMRVFGRDALRRKPLPSGQSYWVEREPPGPHPASMKRMF